MDKMTHLGIAWPKKNCWIMYRLLPTANKVPEGIVFTVVCQLFCPRGAMGLWPPLGVSRGGLDIPQTYPPLDVPIHPLDIPTHPLDIPPGQPTPLNIPTAGHTHPTWTYPPRPTPTHSPEETWDQIYPPPERTWDQGYLRCLHSSRSNVKRVVRH